MKDIEDEIPFDVPDGWSWCRLSLLGEYKKGPFGSALTKAIFVPKSETTIKVYEQKNAIQKNSSLGDYYISKEYFEEKMKSFEVFPGDIIVSCAGTIGETYILPNDIEQGIINQALMRMKITDKISINYFLIFFDHILKDESVKSGKGTAIKNIPPFDVFKQFLIPLPPLAEQQLIVEEIEKIFAQIDLLEQNKTDLQTAIKQAKSKILDLAIHGKLVPQDPNDESASVLLERIRAEKEEKIAKGELKRDKNDSYIYKGSDNCHYQKKADDSIVKIEDEIPFEVPDGLYWFRLNELADIARGGSPRPIENFITDDENGINWIKIGDTAPESKYITSAKEKIISEGKNRSRFVHAGDFLLTNSMSFGRPYILKINGCIHDGWLVFADIKECLYKDFLYYALSSLYIYNSFSLVAAGSTVKNLKSDTVKQVLFPLPPLAEQNRIVSKIEELFSLLDSLENNLV